jgi:predicted nucleic acid-binding protein
MSGVEVFFIDSNVPLYSIDRSEPIKAALAATWLDHLWRAGAGRVSWQVLHEFYWNAVRKMRADVAKTRALVDDFVKWRPIDTSAGLIREAWRWTDSAQLSYWDALIVAAAERSGARYLLSEDLQPGRIFENVQVLNPFEKSPSDFSW